MTSGSVRSPGVDASTRNRTTTLPSAFAGTSSRSASSPAGTQVFTPERRQLEPSFRAIVVGLLEVALILGQRRRENGRAFDDLAAATPLAAPACRTRRAATRRARRSRGAESAPRRAPSARRSAPPRGSRGRRRRAPAGSAMPSKPALATSAQSSRSKRGPARALDLADALVRRLVGEDLLREVGDRLLLVTEREVHGCRSFRRSVRSAACAGRPSPNMPIRSRCTSLVPPPKVRMMRLR